MGASSCCAGGSHSDINDGHGTGDRCRGAWYRRALLMTLTPIEAARARRSDADTAPQPGQDGSNPSETHPTAHTRNSAAWLATVPGRRVQMRGGEWVSQLDWLK